MNHTLIQLHPGGAVKPTPTPVDHHSLLKAFLSGRNVRTIKAYAQDLANFQAFVSARSTEEAARRLMSEGHGPANMLALSYRTHMVERGLKSATINRRLAALRSLVHLARTFGLVPWGLEIQNVKTEAYRDTRGPGKQGFRCLLNEVERKKSKKAVRDRLILHLLYDLALRSGEAVSLDVGDVDMAQGTLAVQGKGKTAKQALTMPEPTKIAMQAWLEIRGGEPGPLLTNFDRAGKGKRLTGVGLYCIVRGLGCRAGLKVRPHGLRHTAITEACKAAQANGIGLEEVLDFSRHSRKSISILMVYRDKERDVQGQLASLVAASV
ncbi:MAG: tyrosine-type recombinase/integrase [Verrucomicrobia bacterium]|nr:tyrosine-type recombinase/integrase [Verrucomicrobiota bacterium]